MELDYTLRTVALGAAVLGAVAGTLGTFAVLRGQSLVGDAVSHAALPGIALAFLLTGTKAPLALMLGAALTGWVAMLLVLTVTGVTRIKYDSALALMLSVFFGFGLLLLTYIQKLPNASQAGLETFLFGQAAALVAADVWTMLLLGAGAVVLLLAGWKEFKLLAFDEAFGQSLGFPMRRLDVLLTTLIVIAVVIGLQTVGVVLMSSLIVAPAVAARQWTDRLPVMALLSALFGALSGVSGALLSSSIPRLPTGPTIVLCASVLVVVSLFAAPNRGLVARWIRDWQNGRRLRQEAVLLDLYALAQQHTDPKHPHAEAVLTVMSERSAPAHRSLRALEKDGYVHQHDATHWSLTQEGIRYADRLLIERGWQPLPAST